MTKTLAQLQTEYEGRMAEAGRSSRQERFQGELIVEVFYAVGKSGHRRSGDKLHLVIAERVVEDRTPADKQKWNRIKVGQVLSARSPCNGNGQHVASVIPGLDTDAVTCRSCLARIEANPRLEEK